MKPNPIARLHKLGQSLWLDDISREMILSGKLMTLIEKHGVSGVTSNPSIFGKAIKESDAYDQSIESLAHAGKSSAEIYEALTVEDVRRAADLLRAVFDRSKGRDGFVSLEVSPRLAHDTVGTIQEALRLWKEVGRPNIFIKVPATLEGVAAMQNLIEEGINVNVTLLFGLSRYRMVARAYIDGIQSRLERGLPVATIASVASFFLSRIDVLIDPILERIRGAGGSNSRLAAAFEGRTAIASAQGAFGLFGKMFENEDFQQLTLQGAHTQRLLWASTSTKNPAYSDVKYVESLIGPQTIITMPEETLEAFEAHGKAEVRLVEKSGAAQRILEGLSVLGLALDDLTQQLEDEGVRKFANAYDLSLQQLDEKRTSLLSQHERVTTVHTR